MKCKCGGELVRIAYDAYKCNMCGKKQTIAFAKLNFETTKETNCININVAAPISLSYKLLKDLEDKIVSFSGVNGK